MKIKRVAWLSLQLLVALCLVVLVIGQVLGQPILLSYVTTGSMEPTIDTGDGFIAVPTELAGEPEVGDVVVFNAQEIENGQLTTHRIVGETEKGFETRGDANPFTDQDGGEPYVKEPQIEAVAWQPGEDVATIPRLGDAVSGVQSLLASIQSLLAQSLGLDALLGMQGMGYLVLLLSIILYLLDIKLADRERYSRKLSRNTGMSTHLLVILFTLLVMAGGTAAMVGPAETHEFGIVSAEFNSESPDLIQQGTTESYDYEFVNTGILSTVVALEPAGDNIKTDSKSMTISGRGTENVSVAITAPPNTGFYQSYLKEHRYIHTLPKSMILSLYDIHPWLPILVINAEIGIPFYLLGRTIMGTGSTRFEQRTGPSRFDRLVGRLR
ncbi:signal peptidase I [Halovenus rubra]|uniref:Signal peptidase I n=2 Tax=Halovenus rubra TaxID=869890 RepID=A0ABD5X304_9EURY|nr:signal peptidase I [Halovenus rubra]